MSISHEMFDPYAMEAQDPIVNAEAIKRGIATDQERIMKDQVTVYAYLISLGFTGAEASMVAPRWMKESDE